MTFACVHAGRERARLCFFLYSTNPFGLRLTFMTSLNLNYLLGGPISKYSHIEVGLQHDFRETQIFSP
jgi:hypothetical protein